MARAEEPAFEVFSQLYGPRLRAYLLYHRVPIDEAESLSVSLVTDIALKSSRFQVERGGLFDSWVFTLARNGLVDWYRQKHRFGIEYPLEDHLLPSEVEADPVAQKDLIDAVEQALAKLSAIDQEILRRRDMESRESFADIARELNIRPDTARVRHLRALRKLEQQLRGDARVQRFLDRLPQAEQRRT